MKRWTIGIGGLLLGTATALSAQTLSEAVTAAWRLNPSTSAAASGLGEAEAQRGVAQQFLIAPPSATLSQRSDRFGTDEGMLTQELEVELPVWRWGQRESRIKLANSRVAAVDGEIALARWQLAGEVREAVWAAALGAQELETARQRLSVAERIEQEVERHVAVGDHARADLLLVLSEKAAAKAGVADAEQRAREAAQRYIVITGLPTWTLPESGAEPPQSSIDSHPVLVRAATERQRAEHAFDNVQQSANEPLSIILGAERERERYGAAANTIVRFGIKVPFGGSSWNRPSVAAANADRVRSDLAQSTARRTLEAEIANARAALRVAESNLATANERLRATEEHAALLRKGFSLGETGLAFLLRAENLLLDAQAGARRQQLQLGQARSRLEHSLGLLP